MSRFLKEKYRGFSEYTPGEQPKNMEYIKLNTNESPYPPSPGVFAAVNELEVSKLNLYPDPKGLDLKRSIAESFGVKPENVFLSNGSDDILNFAFMAFSNENKAVFPEISYGFYEVFSELHGVEYKKIPLKPDFSIDPSDYFNTGALTVIANPNAPTGLCLSLDSVEEILKNNPDNVVVIDEAYVDFGAESAVKLIDKYDNLLVVQTFSKSRSMAGARLGFAFAGKDIISDLEKIKYSTNPYNINRLTMAAGIAAIKDGDYYSDNCKKIISTRNRLSSELKNMGYTLTDSKANFIFAKSPKISGKDVYEELKNKGILIRHFSLDKIADYNRITIGNDEQADALLTALKEIENENR